MTDTIFGPLGNIGPEQLQGLKQSCDKLKGSLFVQQEAGGNFTVACQRSNPVAPKAAAKPCTVDPTRRDTDPANLHPQVRNKVAAIQDQLDNESIPLKFFEGFRTPQRQAYLYAKGRTAPGPRVTNADAWESHHQYGVAADFVRFENGDWNWGNDTDQEKSEWRRFHEIARANDLEPLSWEKPHVQLADYSLTRLSNGAYPDSGDESWAENLTKAILGWSGNNAPPLPDEVARPEMMVAGKPAGNSAWHSMFGGDAWSYDRKGVYTPQLGGGVKLWRTPGAPITAQEVLARFDGAIRAASQKHDVPQELIVMTIATETGAYRKYGFTGPRTFRWEQGYTVRATGQSKLDGKEKGDYSAGPMQVMADTARWMNNAKSLGYNNAKAFKFYKNRPTPAPTTVGLYDAQTCIDVGTAYIRQNMGKTGIDPLLVAAAYNAGGLYPSSGNHWRIRSTGNHIDRAAEWYGDACAVLYG